jgi:hypothetical protein
MTIHEKFSYVRARGKAFTNKRVVNLREQNQLIFCHHELNEHFQSKYFPNGKYSRPTQPGVNDGYFFRSNADGLSHYLCQ